MLKVIFFFSKPAVLCWRGMNPVGLITGASRGIGRGIAVALAEVGYDLVLDYAHNQQAAERTAADCQAAAEARGLSARVEIFKADISNRPDRENLMRFARQKFGRLDLLVNNAGVAPEARADVLEASEESFDRLININVKGPYFLTQLAARWMIEQTQAAKTAEMSISVATPPSPLRKGRVRIDQSKLGLPKIITISSISAYTASTNRGDYCVSKAALSMLTPLFATRLAEHGIQVYEIRPGIIATDMTEPVREKYDQLISEGLTPIRRWGIPEDVGKAVVAIAQGLLPFSTGEVINVDGGFHLRRL
jgi:NAD(P)-dependent dehydrogenase (short-subunit alcohol dehydrogenase family)